MDVHISREPDSHRYVLRNDGAIVCVLEYADRGAGTAFTSTVTVPHERGKGWADKLVAYAVNDVEARGAGPVIPMCWYVAEWFDRHPEKAELRSA